MSIVDKVNLSQVKKCKQYWSEMDKIEGGRLCSQCDRKIIDFRKSTNKHVAETHAFATDKVCGLYRKEQLKMQKKRVNLFLRPKIKGVYVGLLGLLTNMNGWAEDKVRNSHITAQFADEEEDVERKIVSHNRAEVSTKSDSLYVKGKLIDDNNDPVPFAYIIIEGTKSGTISDLQGNYSLNVTEALHSADAITLAYRYIGLAEEKIIIQKSEIVDIFIQDVQLTADDNLIVFAITEKRPWYKRLWMKIKRPFRGNRR